MTALVEGFRASVLGGPIPWPAVAVSACAAVGLSLVGCLYFRKVEDDYRVLSRELTLTEWRQRSAFQRYLDNTMRLTAALQ